jgi:hypothetical protein
MDSNLWVHSMEKRLETFTNVTTLSIEILYLCVKPHPWLVSIGQMPRLERLHLTYETARYNEPWVWAFFHMIALLTLGAGVRIKRDDSMSDLTHHILDCQECSCQELYHGSLCREIFLFAIVFPFIGSDGCEVSLFFKTSISSWHL